MKHTLINEMKIDRKVYASIWTIGLILILSFIGSKWTYSPPETPNEPVLDFDNVTCWPKLWHMTLDYIELLEKECLQEIKQNKQKRNEKNRDCESQLGFYNAKNNQIRERHPNIENEIVEYGETNIETTPDIDYNPTSYGEDTKDWFYLSHYNVGDVNQNDESPCHWATWADICRVLEWWDRVIALVEPYREKYGIEYRDRVVLEWDEACSGEFIVLDEMNERYRNPDDSTCAKNKWSPYCIRGDIAYPYGVKGAWGNCYIKEVKKAE